ncbi:hypothetical protein N657DRAFT_475536 [Parathielavia appendiculata]|uniref:Uncharacterized protein n=1 Tax=Parathielavia appendiculata TaxID=2587402 RepID=A0AAN6TXQ9_9PEZI|nr:hypothetical protein N657DRAFT_475536 [Parathielavia appendiculata]
MISRVTSAQHPATFITPTHVVIIVQASLCAIDLALLSPTSTANLKLTSLHNVLEGQFLHFEWIQGQKLPRSLAFLFVLKIDEDSRRKQWDNTAGGIERSKAG